MNKTDKQPLADQTNPSGKYIYLAIAAYWLAGIIVAGYIFALPHSIEIRFDLLRALLVSYLFGMSLLVSHSYCRNIGPSLLFSILLPCVPLAVGVPSLFPLFAFGLSVVAWRRRSSISDSVGHIGTTEIAALIVAASAFAAITLTATQAGGAFFVSDVYHQFFNLDGLYHSALTAMIKNYGISSTGLNGLLIRHYHIFSHIVFAAISFGTGLSAMASFGILQFILIEPLLLLAIVATAETIRPSANARSFFIRIAVLFAAFQMIVAWPVFDQFSLSDSYFISQSYTLSLILMLATLCAMQMARGNYKLLTLIALVLLTAASKISTGVICFAMVSIHLAWFDPSDRGRRIAAWITMAMGFGALLFLFRWANKISDLFDGLDMSSILKYGPITIIAISVTTASLIALSRRPALTAPIRLRLGQLPPFVTGIIVGICCILLSILLDSIVLKSVFLHTYGGVPENSHAPGFWLALGKFTLGHFCFTWLLAGLAAMLYLTDKSKAKYLAAPLLYSIAALIISWAVLFLTDLGSAEFYFTNVAMFIALPFLLTLLGDRISNGIKASIAEGALAALIVILLGTLESDWNKCYSRGTTVNLFRRMSCNLSWERNAKYSHIIDYLDEIRRDNSTKKLGVYVAREESDFWTAGGPTNCLQRPFVIPAVSERPALLALPDMSCNPTGSGYGFIDHKDDAFAMSALPRISPEILMTIAEKAGLEGYVDVTKNGWTVYKNDAVATPTKQLATK